MSVPRLVRTEARLGAEGMERLAASHVLLIGLGGVGGHAFDALVRSGIGRLTLVDFDRVDESNINRQLLADATTVGRLKTEVAVERAALISENVNITIHSERLTPEGVEELLAATSPALVLDAIDDVPTMVALAVQCVRRGVPILMCLGTGNRLDPAALRVTDLAKTAGCPLARAIRARLRREGITHLPVVASDEPALAPQGGEVRVGSSAFVPASAGLLMAAEAVRLLTHPTVKVKTNKS